jgi:putative glutamine amidotransferase
MTKKKPIIGVTLDSEQKGSYSDYPYYALRKSYATVLHELGAAVIFLSYDESSIKQYLDMVDGILFAGGDVDIDPTMYGEKIRSKKININKDRSKFEIAFAKEALKIDKPILAICAGMQLINVLKGGSLHQDIGEELPRALEHYQKTPRTETWHDIKIKKNSLLHQIVGQDSIAVNSHHHQAVKEVGIGVIDTAHAEDGVIEAIEIPNREFFLGIEWHPEMLANPVEKKIFEAFVAACQK